MKVDQPKQYESRFVIRLGGELAIKGPQAQKMYLERIFSSLKEQAKGAGEEIKIFVKHRHFVLVSHNPSWAESVLGRQFGVGSFSQIEKTVETDFEKIVGFATEWISTDSAGSTYSFKVKRSGNPAFTSQDIEREVGHRLIGVKKVDFKNPDSVYRADIINKDTYFYRDRKKGMGGLSAGKRDRVLVLLSGGFDSAVAAWRMMKRGIGVDFVFFNLGGLAYERLVLQVAKVLNDLWSKSTNSSFVSVEFGAHSKEISSRVKSSYAQLVLKREMLRVAGEIARSQECRALVTGDALGQVSSQTFSNLIACDDAAGDIPVFRPLIGMDKSEIMDDAKKAGTYLLSARIREYCSISSGRPITRAKGGTVREEELNIKRVNVSDLDIRVRHLDKLTAQDLRDEHLFLDAYSPDYQWIDCQLPHMSRTWSVPESRRFEIQDLIANFRDLDQSKKYAIYCSHGTQSPLAAEIMQQYGYEAYAYKGKIENLKKEVATAQRSQ